MVSRRSLRITIICCNLQLSSCWQVYYSGLAEQWEVEQRQTVTFFMQGCVLNQSWVYKSLMNIPLKLWILDIRLCFKWIGLKCSRTDDDYSFPFRKSLTSSFLGGKHKFQGFLLGSTLIRLKWPASLKILYGQTMQGLHLFWLYEDWQLNRPLDEQQRRCFYVEDVYGYSTVIVALRPCFLYREKERGVEQGRQVERMTQCRMRARRTRTYRRTPRVGCLDVAVQ